MAKATQIHVLYIRLRSTNDSWIASPRLRRCLVADAVKDGSNLHDVAVGILSKSFGVPFVPSGRHTTPAVDGEELNLRVSDELWRAISAAAASTRPKKALEVLHAHYRLEPPKVKRRARAAA